MSKVKTEDNGTLEVYRMTDGQSVGLRVEGEGLELCVTLDRRRLSKVIEALEALEESLS